MINKEVFVKEIEQTYTILKQNLILIKYVEDLISQGNTLEEAVSKIDIPIYYTNAVITQDMINKIKNKGCYCEYGSNFGYLFYLIDYQDNENTKDTEYVDVLYVEYDTQTYYAKYIGKDDIGKKLSDINQDMHQLASFDAVDQLDTKVSNINDKLPTNIGVKTYNGSQALILKHNNTEITGQTNPVRFKNIFGNQSIIGSGSIDLYTHTLTLTGKQTLESENTTSFYFTKDSSVSSPINDVTQLLQIFKSSKLDVPFLALGTESNLQVWAILFKSQGVFKIRTSTGTEYFITAVEDAVETL